jgi:predicted lactoylglutathione lyase
LDESSTSVRYGVQDYAQFYIHTKREPISGIHLCFEVESRDLVNAFYESAISAGGKDNGKPGIREDYGSTYYATFVIDPDGNNIEAVHRG